MRRLAWLALFACTGCNHPTGVVLTVDGQGIVADQLRLTASYDNGTQTRLVPGTAAGPLSFPTDLFAEFDAHPLAVTFTVEALDGGTTVASVAMPAVAVMPNAIEHVAAQLVATAAPSPSPPEMPMPDAGAPPHVAYASVVLADAPLAYYRLDETSGTVAHDSSGHGLNGTYGANVTHGVGGLLIGDSDLAASFSGGNWSSDGIVVVPPTPMLEPTQAVSVELWMRQPVLNLDGAVMVDYGDAGPSSMQDPAYGLLIYKNAFNVFLWTDVAAGGGPNFGSVTKPAVSQVYHVVETFDGQSVRVFVNGALDSSMPVSGHLAFANGRGGLGIGGTAMGGAGDLVFGGVLDEVAIYGVALTPAQVMKHFVAGMGMAK